MISASGVSFGYDAELVLREVALVAEPGVVVGLIGPNGSTPADQDPSRNLLVILRPRPGGARMSTDRGAVAAVSAAWDRRAGAHNDYYAAFSETGPAQWREMYRLAIIDLLGPEHGRIRALDVGTGTGFVATVLAELDHDVTGVDGSQRMLEHSRRWCGTTPCSAAGRPTGGA